MGALHRRPRIPAEVRLAIPAPASPGDWQQVIERCLSPLVGDFTARMALRTAALRTFKCAPEAVARAEVPALVEGLRPMLSTLLGAVPTDGVLAQIQKELVGR